MPLQTMRLSSSNQVVILGMDPSSSVYIAMQNYSAEELRQCFCIPRAGAPRDLTK